jgi:hypothetical protein
MTDIVRPGAGIVFMKVGQHARETLEDIIDRKRREIQEAGYALWGYGGGTCHPLSTVQPFARAYERRGNVIFLCMQPMKSSHSADPARASESSADGLHWEAIPPAINVLGSRYALAISDLHRDEFELPLEHTRVASGLSRGRAGSSYIGGRVDKACLEVTHEELDVPDERLHIRIELVAKLVEPYAVLLRN